MQILTLAGNALYEETFYRGYLIPALTPEVGGRKWAAVLLAAALFGLMHIANYWVRGVPMGLLIPATLAGVLKMSNCRIQNAMLISRSLRNLIRHYRTQDDTM